MQWIYVGIALAGLVLAAAGKWWLQWPDSAVGAWVGISCGFLLCVLLLALLPRWWREHCDEMYAQPAGKRYIRALLPIMLGYAVALYGSMTLINRGIASMPLRAVVAVLPALAIALLMWVALRYLREIDEMQRRIETEAIGISALGVSLLYFAGGLLDLAKVLSFNAGAVMIWVFPLLMLLYGICKYILTKRFL